MPPFTPAPSQNQGRSPLRTLPGPVNCTSSTSPQYVPLFQLPLLDSDATECPPRITASASSVWPVAPLCLSKCYFLLQGWYSPPLLPSSPCPLPPQPHSSQLDVYVAFNSLPQQATREHPLHLLSRLLQNPLPRAPPRPCEAPTSCSPYLPHTYPTVS